MKIAVTGSSGLIGSALVAHLLDIGHQVIRVVRTATDEPDAIRWDPDAGEIDAAGLEGVDAVVNLAGEGIADHRWTPAQKRRIHDSRRRGTELLAATLAGLDRPPQVLLSGSAIGIYGDTGATPTDETAEVADDFLATVCIDWEAATAAAAAAGIRVAFLRTGIVLSPDGGALAKQLPFFKVGLGGRSGSGRQWQSWISLDDEVGAITWLLDHPVSGPVNLVAPGAVTNAEFASTLGAVLHRPTTIIPMIGPRALYGRELADSLLLTSQRIEPGVLTDGGYEFRHPELDGALRDLLG